MNRETFRKLQPNTRIVINNKHSGKTVGKEGMVSKIASKADGVVQIHLDGNKSKTNIHYSKLDIVELDKEEESVTIPKIETTAEETGKPEETTGTSENEENKTETGIVG